MFLQIKKILFSSYFTKNYFLKNHKCLILLSAFVPTEMIIKIFTFNTVNELHFWEL